jgi:hypothetical protein
MQQTYVKLEKHKGNIGVRRNSAMVELFNFDVPEENSNGYFVFFLYNNVQDIYFDKEKFIEQFMLIMKKDEIRSARIALPHCDRVVVDTFSDRKSRQELYDALTDQLKCKQGRSFWFPQHEDEKVHKNATWLKMLNDIYDNYNKKLKRYSEPVGKNILLLQSKLYNILYMEEVMNRDSMVVNPIFRPIRYDIRPKTAFVLMPFGEKWSDDSYCLIQKAGKKADVDIKRADDFFEPNVIMEDIWQHINESSVIIADITVHNPNVFYELGIAHTLGKTVILIKQPNNDVSVPFDIQGKRFLEYGLNPTQTDTFIDRLANLLQSLA